MEAEQLQPPHVQPAGRSNQSQKKLGDVAAYLHPEALFEAAGPNRLAGYCFFRQAHALGAQTVRSAAAEGQAAQDSDQGSDEASTVATQLLEPQLIMVSARPMTR